jgi:hypothetical protein
VQDAWTLLQSVPIPATLGDVTLRIMLSDDTGDSTPARAAAAVREPVTARRPGPAVADWSDQDAPPLLLYLADEPEIGRRFSYGGARWEIVDYQDGWIARLVVAR